MKSMFVCPIMCSIFSFVIHCRLSAISKITRATKTEVYMLMATPSQRVTAKPRIWSVPTM